MTRSATRVRRVETRRDLTRFIDLPYRLYRDDPCWVAPLRLSERERFDPAKNPFFEHARIDLYLAERDGRVVGRIAAIDDDAHNRTHGDNLLFFGFFEAEHEPAALALYEAVERRGRELGRDLLRGPANPSMNDASGFQLDAYHTRPVVMMPYNPPEYVRWAEAAGLAKVKDLYAWMAYEHKGIPERFQRLARRVRQRYEPIVRHADMAHYERELALLKHVYNEAWEKNWGFVKYTEAEFDHLARELKMIIDPRTVLFLELDGEVAGVALGIPDINQVLAKFHGRLLPFGIVHLLRRRRIIDQLRLAILGVLPEYRNRGLELVLIEEIFRRGTAVGYGRAELSWILEDNDGINKGIQALGAELHKRYRLFQKPL